MSLLFEYAIRAFAPADATHVAAAESALSDADGPVDGDALAVLAGDRARYLAHPEREDWRCVPLHGTDSAELSGEYVVAVDHPVRGHVFVYRDPDTGDPTPVAASSFGTTRLARRLRFWLPGFAPDDQPSYARDGPATTVEPVAPVADPEGFFDRLAGFVASERDAERERNRERAAQSLDSLAAADEGAVPDVEGASRVEDDRYRFRAVPPDGSTHGDVRDRFGVFEGDELLLHGGTDAPSAFPLRATVVHLAGFAIAVAVEFGDDPAARRAAERHLDAGNLAGLSVLLNPVPYDRERDAVESARRDDALRALVTGGRPARFAREAARRTPLLDDDLDESQELAAVCALYADDVCCVHGPPGTGKTRALVEVVRRAVAAGDRILVCADSNQGVDNALVGESVDGEVDPESLHYHARVADEFALARHRPEHAHRSFVRERYAESPPRPDVTATTNNSAAEFDDGEFDLAVVDEATQATITSTLIPATKADRLVLAGDHHQLPPFEATERPADDDRHRSLFEHFYADDGVYGHRIGVRLATQYRMHPDVAAFSNREFYGGRLRNGRDVEPVDGLPPLLGVDVAGAEREDGEHSYANPAEVEVVVRIVDRLREAGVAPGDVGVIAPYQGQVAAIRDAVEGAGSARAEERAAGAVAVDTVDSFQGSEREAVVVSFVRSNDRGDVGFLSRRPDGPRRLNVALTRAKRFVALVADWDTLRADHGDGAGECADLYRRLYDHVADRGRMLDAADPLPGENGSA